MQKKTGTRLQVWRGKATKTTGGLKKTDLTKNKHGKIVSKTKSTTAKHKSNLGKMLTNKKKRETFEISKQNIVKGKRNRKKTKR